MSIKGFLSFKRAHPFRYIINRVFSLHRHRVSPRVKNTKHSFETILTETIISFSIRVLFLFFLFFSSSPAPPLFFCNLYILYLQSSRKILTELRLPSPFISHPLNREADFSNSIRFLWLFTKQHFRRRLTTIPQRRCSCRMTRAKHIDR